MADLYSLHMMVTSKIRSVPKSNKLSPSFGQSPFTDRTETEQRFKADTRIHKQTMNIYVSPWKGGETYCFPLASVRLSVCPSQK